jgi:hypothetical protein
MVDGVWWMESARIRDRVVQYMGADDKFTSMHKLQDTISSRPTETARRRIGPLRPAGAMHGE